jgi:hypothetical protein
MPTRLTQYALAHTYRILTPNRNRRTAKCVGCGVALEADFGQEVHEQSWYVGRVQIRFLCPACFGEVKQAHEEHPPPEWDTRPVWWGELGREGRTRAERVKVRRPGDKEIDALIAEREKERGT